MKPINGNWVRIEVPDRRRLFWLRIDKMSPWVTTHKPKFSSMKTAITNSWREMMMKDTSCCSSHCKPKCNMASEPHHSQMIDIIWYIKIRKKKKKTYVSCKLYDMNYHLLRAHCLTHLCKFWSKMAKHLNDKSAFHFTVLSLFFFQPPTSMFLYFGFCQPRLVIVALFFKFDEISSILQNPWNTKKITEVIFKI